MPYIKPEYRKEFMSPDTPGKLNYMITTLCDEFVREYGLCYESINSVVGVLECAKQEFYRRIAAPMEDYKKTQNGDVYSPETRGLPF